MARLNRGSWADAKLFRYKYVQLLAKHQNDTLRRFLCTRADSPQIIGTMRYNTKSSPKCDLGPKIALILSYVRVGDFPFFPVGPSVFSCIKWEQSISLKVVVSGNDMQKRIWYTVWCIAGIQAILAFLHVYRRIGLNQCFQPLLFIYFLLRHVFPNLESFKHHRHNVCHLFVLPILLLLNTLLYINSHFYSNALKRKLFND